MVFQGTKKTNKGHQVRLQTLSFDLYMKNQGRGGGGWLQTRLWVSIGGGGGRGATNETMDLCQGVVRSTGGGGGLQKRPWVSIGGRRGYRRDHRPLSGVGGGGGLQKRSWVSIGGRGVTDETMGLYRRGATEETMGLYRGQEGLQKRPWASIRGGVGATEEIMGLYRGEGGYR